MGYSGAMIWSAPCSGRAKGWSSLCHPLPATISSVIDVIIAGEMGLIKEKDRCPGSNQVQSCGS